MHVKRLWVAWETQRRSIELADLLGCDLEILEAKGLFRYPSLSLRTLHLLWKNAPTLLFVQNPSVFLAALASVYSRLTRVALVVDRHSNFPEFSSHRAWRGRFGTVRAMVFHVLSKFSLKAAALTIVTNEALGDVVRAQGGTSFVLPDPVPFHIESGGELVDPEVPRILVVCSYADDEPIAEILNAAGAMEGEVEFRFTGNPVRGSKDWRFGAPSNADFIGFVSRAQYEQELREATAVLVLTANENCLLCGCYEALAVGKPLVTSNTNALRHYFYDAIHVEATSESIRDGVCDVLTHLPSATERVRAMASTIDERWQEQFALLKVKLSALEVGSVDR